MKPGLTLTLPPQVLIGPANILKNGKMSTLMKIETFILKTSISDIFQWCSCQGLQREERSYMFLLKGTAKLELLLNIPRTEQKGQNRPGCYLKSLTMLTLWRFHYLSNKVNIWRLSLSQTLHGQDRKFLQTRRLLLSSTPLSLFHAYLLQLLRNCPLEVLRGQQRRGCEREMPGAGEADWGMRGVEGWQYFFPSPHLNPDSSTCICWI